MPGFVQLVILLGALWNIVFEELVILDKPRLLYWALYLGFKKSMARVAAVREPAGVPHASPCCLLVGVMIQITSSLSGEDIWFCFSQKIKGTTA